MNPLSAVFVAALIALALAHSQMTDPQSIAPWTCRLGGEPQFGVETCAGPCDMRGIQSGNAVHGSPSNPARVYRRGQEVLVKYARNNHAPGGFVRLTLVEPSKMMSKKEHEKNAFYYSCWGANAVKAQPNELRNGKFGFSFIGTDAEQHNLPAGYYTTKVKIPKVIPDGDYVLGWVWFGGAGGGEVENNGRATKRPVPYGYFSDYWSCSYVRIQGGAPLESRHVPVFNNDMSQFSSEGCMSANDFPGVCSYEPCRVTGRYQKPRPFANGRTPRALTPQDFGGKQPTRPNRAPAKKAAPKRAAPKRAAPKRAPIKRAPIKRAPIKRAPSKKASPPTSPRTAGNSNGLSYEMRIRKRSCKCLGLNGGCWLELAKRTKNYCKGKTPAVNQPTVCKEACCVFCKFRPSSRACRSSHVRRICML